MRNDCLLRGSRNGREHDSPVRDKSSETSASKALDVEKAAGAAPAQTALGEFPRPALAISEIMCDPITHPATGKVRFLLTRGSRPPQHSISRAGRQKHSLPAFPECVTAHLVIAVRAPDWGASSAAGALARPVFGRSACAQSGAAPEAICSG